MPQVLPTPVGGSGSSSPVAVLRGATTVEANTTSIRVDGRGVVSSLSAGAIAIDVSDAPWHQGSFLANLATSGDHPLSGTADVDGQAVVADTTLVLAWEQTDPTENGLYVASAGAWSRAPFFTANSNPEGEPYVYAGARVYVAGGDTYTDVTFFLTNTFSGVSADPRTMTPDFGVDPIVFVQLTGGGGSGMPSDTSETEIKATGTFTTSPAASAAIEVLNFREIDVSVEVTDKTGITEFVLRAEYSTEESPSVWQPVQSDDDIISGDSTPSDLVYRQGTSPAVTFRRGATFPVKGRWMRFMVSADAASGAYSVVAYRRG